MKKKTQAKSKDTNREFPVPLNVYLTEAQAKEIQEASKLAGASSMSGWARERLLEAARAVGAKASA